MWTIYCHTHIESGRRYIGQTKMTWQRRWKGHIAAAYKAESGHGHFTGAIRAHGPDAFSHEVLEICATQQAADAAEIRWIAEHDTTDRAKGFNRRPGGQGDNWAALRKTTGSPESRAKRSERAKAQWADPQFKAKLSAIQTVAQKEVLAN